MTKTITCLLAAVLLMACANDATIKSAADSTAAAGNVPETEAVELPYSVPGMPDWERGKAANVAVAMNTLKAYADNDMSRLQQYLADSVEFYTDNLSFKGSRDSLVKLFTVYRNRMDSIDIRMHDYESVASKSRGQEWVSLWYTETSRRKGGATDSAMVMDDVKIINGKVATIDSKLRRLGKQ